VCEKGIVLISYAFVFLGLYPLKSILLYGLIKYLVMQKQTVIWIPFVLITFFSTSLFSQKLNSEDLQEMSDNVTDRLLQDKLIIQKLNLTIDSAFVYKDARSLELYFSKELTYLPIREDFIESFKASVRSAQKRKIRKHYQINIYSAGEIISTYIPNLFREETSTDSSRFDVRKQIIQNHVKNLDNVYQVTDGLQNKHIAIWGGHGLYYSNQDSLWQWQRPNLFTTVEDLFTYSYVVPYIMPMLENAGANVYYPKERDTQTQELVVDFDSDRTTVLFTKGVKQVEGGFKLKEFYTDYENPFSLGTHHEMDTSVNSGENDSISYDLKGVDKGEFAVYISYSKTDNNVSDVEYEVYHDGGKTTFVVNQQMGFGTWVYLGKFQFGNSDDNRIVVKNTSKYKGVITSDAIKIGGGFNRIERNGTISDKPAYMNAGRYYLQYAGMPDSSVYTLTKGNNDYKDDYRSRGEWVDYLLGQPYCSNRDSSLQGLNIPIDLSLAFHTDATTTKTDSVVGTLTIHSTYGLHNERVFPDGRSRFASRDLADIVHTEIVEVIHEKYNPKWVRRAMWDKQYSEATYPNVPSMLIELLSHQNFGDMKYGLDPNFKFDVSRAIYKGVLKYLSSVNGTDYVVQPLPVNSFAVKYKNKKIELSWEQTIDKTEETANADAYILYTKIGNGGFDNGILVKGNSYIMDDFEFGEQYSFKVKAVNKGGVSFDSEILSACIFTESSNPILIINAFDKVSAPEFFDTDSLGGFAYWKKSAIASGADVSYTGNQYNFDKTKPWVTNPITGHGASYSNGESILRVGNTFNYPSVHGHKFAKHNLSYISTSIRAFEENISEYTVYNKIDLIYGKQSTYKSPANKHDYSIFREATRNAMSTWLSEGKSIFVSGAFVASDVFMENESDTTRVAWVKNNLNYNIVTDKASVNGIVKSDDAKFEVNKDAVDNNYELRSVDALKPIDEGAIMYRYEENNYPAGVYTEVNGYRIFVLGFPFSSVVKNQDMMFDEIISKLNWD
jgi:hypothetical protein